MPSQTDPFASVTPTTPSGGCANDPNVKPSETVNLLHAGCYKALSIKGTANLAPGVYYIDGGDIDFNSGANINCSPDGVMFVLSNSNAAANAAIGDDHNERQREPQSNRAEAGTYKGMLIYQDRTRPRPTTASRSTATAGPTSRVRSISRTADFTWTANSGMNSNCMQLVVKRISFTGNSAVSNTCPANSGAGSFKGSKVRLVE